MYFGKWQKDEEKLHTKFFSAFVCKKCGCNFTFAKGKISLQICNLYVPVVHKIAAFSWNQTKMVNYSHFCEN